MTVTKQIRAIVFDWGRTIWNPDEESLFPEAKEVLSILARDHKLMIVSLATKGEEEITKRRKLIESLGLAPLFADIVFVTEEKDAAYESLYKKHGLSFGETAIVDDRAIRGIAWGNRVGARTVWFKNGKFADETPNDATGQPTHVIKDFRELLIVFDLA